jgi:hypothetical protein
MEVSEKMKKLMNKVQEKMMRVGIVARNVMTSTSGEGFVDSAVKILISVVIGALLLAGLYKLFGDTILPTLTQRIKDMFNFAG